MVSIGKYKCTSPATFIIADLKLNGFIMLIGWRDRNVLTKFQLSIIIKVKSKNKMLYNILSGSGNSSPIFPHGWKLELDWRGLLLLRVYLLPAVAFLEVEQPLFHNINDSILMIPFGILQVFFFWVLMTLTSYIVQQAATIKMFFKFRNYHNYPTQSMPMENGQTMGMTNEE